jgi:hypothetical protein
MQTPPASGPRNWPTDWGALVEEGTAMTVWMRYAIAGLYLVPYSPTQ